MPPQVKRTDAGTGPLIELEEVSEETPVGLAGETIPTGEVDDASLNFVGEEIPEDKWTQDEDGNIIIPAESESENFVGEELTLEGAPKYKDGIYTLEGFKEWEQQEKEEGRDGFWHWATKTLPEASKEAFSYLYEGGKQIPDKFKEDPLKATAIFPEAALSAAEGWVDIATGAADLAQRPFRAADENQKARYERYKMFAERTKRILEDRKSRVGDAIRSAGYLLDKDFNEYAAKYDEGINPASADTLGIVLDPGALFGGGIYRTAGRVVGRPSIAANKALNNVIKGINQGTTKKIFDVAKETLKRPATQTAKGAGKLVDAYGTGLEKLGKKISDLGQEGRYLQQFPQTAKNIGEALKAKGIITGTPGQIVSVVSEAAQKGGRRQTGLGIVKKKGTLRDRVQKGVQLLDTPLSDKILRNAGDLADKITKGTAIGMGTGYVAGGAEGAAAGAGFGAFGGGLGYGAEKAAKYTPLVRNKFRGMERLKLDEEFITDYASRLPEDQRKAFLNPDRRMGVSDLAAEADAAQLFQGYMSKKGSNVDVKYTNGEGMVKAASSDPDNPNLNARFQYGFYDKKSNTIHINTDASGTGRNRTLFHELFHPTEYFSSPSIKQRFKDKGEGVDPFGDTRAELEQVIFGTFDEAGNRRSDGLYTDKQMLDFENQYLDAVFQQNQNSPLGRKITEARKIRDEAIKKGDAEATDQITYLLGQYELQKRQNKKAKENYLKGDIATRRKNITSEILSEHFANFGEQSHFGLLRNAKDVLFKNKFNKNTLGNKLTKLSLSTLGGMRRMLEGKGVTFDAAGKPKGDFKAESKIFIDPLTGENLITSPEVEHLLAQYVVALDTVNNRLSLEGSGFDTVETAGSLKDKKRSDLTPEREKQLREIGWLEDFDGNDNPIFSTARKRNKEHKEEVAKVIDILNANPEDSGETKMWRKAKTKAGRDRWESGIPSEKQMEALRNSDIDPTYVEKIEKIRNAILKGDGTIWGNDYYKAITGGGYDSKAKVKFSLIVPFSLEATQAGNINIKSLNLSKLEAKIKNYAEQRPAFFEAWGKDPDAFRKDIVDFFQGPSRGKLFPEGEQKDLIYQFLNIKNKKNPLTGDWVDNSRLIESNRIERSTNLKPYDDLDKIPFDYTKMLNRQYMPEPKGEEGARFMPPPAEGAFNKAKETFGTTKNQLEAGFILPDGEMLDFSGRHEGADERDVAGKRYSDHREISQTGVEMTQFINSGAVRIDARSGLIEIGKEPTTSQLSQIRKIIEDKNSEVYIDLQDLNRRDVAEQDTTIEPEAGTDPKRVIGLIRRFYGGGDISNAVRFMPAPTFFSKAERAVEGAKAGIFNKEGLATVDQAKALLQKNAPQTELEWSGVLDYLDLQKEQGNKVSKDDLLNYIKSNGVEIEEVIRGGSDTDTLREKYADQMFQMYEIDKDPDDPGYVAIDENGEMLREFGGDIVRFESSILDAEAGLKDILFDEAQKMRDTDLREIVGDASESGGPTVFKADEIIGGGRATLPGGENYRELVLKLPEGSLKEGESEYFPTPSGHRFPEDNILAHIRFTERTDADGKKMLFLEEVQSDWNTEGRRSGFKKKRPAKVQEELDKLKAERDKIKKSDAFKHLAYLNVIKEAKFRPSDLKIKELNDRISETKNEKYSDLYDTPEKLRQHAKDVKTRIEKIETEYPAYPAGAPDMPYKGSKWEDLTMKRMIRYAADNGYDRLGWITGKDTADRYNLSKVVSEVFYNEKTQTLTAFDKEGNDVLVKDGIPADKVANYIGKETAEKLLKQPLNTSEFKVNKDNKDSPYRLEQKDSPGIISRHSTAEDAWAEAETLSSTRQLTGTDLEVGGEWAENLYDKSLPSKAKKITKKKGAVGRTSLGGESRDNKKRKELSDELKEVEKDITRNLSLVDNDAYKETLSKRNEILSELGLPKPTTAELAGASVMLEKNKKRKKQIEKELKELDDKGTPEANYVDITPEVKEIAEEGFSYFMPAGRAGSGSAPMQTGSPQPPSAGVFMPKVKLTEEEKEESKRILEKL